MAPQADRAEETRRRIIEVSAEAFAQRGYAATSLNDLVKASGLTKGAFYFHFDSKEALALEVFRSKHEEWGAKVMACSGIHERAFDQLAEIMRTVAVMIEADPSSRCVGRIAEDLAADPALAATLRQQFEAWVSLSVDLLGRAIEEGDVRKDLDVRAASEVMVASFIGLEKASGIHELDLPTMAEVFVGLLREAVRPREPART